MPKDKFFANFTRSRAVQNGGSRSNGVQRQGGREPSDRKVLVDVGDKCVPHAKSKPKRRKMVRHLPGKNGDQELLDQGDASVSAPTTDGIVWSDDAYPVQYLVKEFFERFPIIVRVDQGHYREGVVDLSRGQLLLIINHGRQKRVLAKNNRSQSLLSLPFDYQMDIYIPTSQETIDFNEAMVKKRLPLTATVSSIGPDSADSSQENITSENLTFISVKDTVFLRALSIDHGWIDQSEIVVIPELLQVEFSVAQGILGGTEQEWLDYYGMFARSVRHLDLQSIPGYQGILLEGPDGDELLTSTFRLVLEETVTADPPGPAEEEVEKTEEEVEKNNPRQRIRYENVLLPTEDGIHGAVDNESGSNPPGVNRHSSDAEVRLISYSNGTLDYRKPSQGDRPISINRRSVGQRVEDKDVEEVEEEESNHLQSLSLPDSESIDDVFDYLNTDRVSQAQPSDRDSHASTNPEVNGPVSGPDTSDVTVTSSSNNENDFSGIVRGKSSEQSASDTSSRMSGVNVLELANRFNAVNRNEGNQKPFGHALQSRGDRPISVKLKPQEEPAPTTCSENGRPSFTNRNSIIGHLQPPVSGHQKEKIPLSSSKSPQPCPPSQLLPPKHDMPSRNSQKNRIMPPRLPSENSSTVTPAMRETSPVMHDVVIRTSADVPSDLETLSVSNVGQCLQLMGLDKYVQRFKEASVDGRKLSDMTEKILERDFGFSPLDASKLIRFLRGWRP